MRYRVELYIYDLSAGMARQLAPMLGLGGPMGLNFDLDGIWHTAIVVHNNEWFFGGGGIEHCSPGGTMMGRPLKIEHLGQTDLDLDSYRDYLYGLGQDQFRGDRYDLFKHNCNNFSNVVAQFLCGKTIPHYILELPQKFLNSPIAAMIQPFIEQATPHGVAMSSEEHNTTSQASYHSPAASSGGATSKKKENKTSYIGFTAELVSDKVISKIRELNSDPDKSGHALSEEQLAKIGYLLDRVAMLDVKVWNEVFKPVLAHWPLKDLFPLIDVVRWCSVVTQLPAVVMADVIKIVKDRNLIDIQSPESVVRLILRLLSNFFLFENSRTFLRGHASFVVNQIQSLVESLEPGRDHLELASTSVLHNFAFSLQEQPDQDLAFLLTSALSTVCVVKVKNFDALHRVISTLILLISGDAETKDLALALDLKMTLQNLTKLDKNVESAALECISLLN